MVDITTMPNIVGSDANEVIKTTDVGTAVKAGGGDDVVTGGKGNDVISAGGGNDQISGGAGSDVILAGDGDDVIRGGADGDVMEGGSGADTFYFDSKSVDCSTDIIMDFSTGEGDKLKFSAGVTVSAVEGGNFSDGFGNGHSLQNEHGTNDIKLTLFDSNTGKSTTVWLLDVISGGQDAAWWQDYFL